MDVERLGIQIRSVLLGDTSLVVRALVWALLSLPELAFALRVALRVAPAWTRSDRWSTRGGISWVYRVEWRDHDSQVWAWRALGCEGVEVERRGAEDAADAILRANGYALARWRVSWCRECERTALRVERPGVGICPTCQRVHEIGEG